VLCVCDVCVLCVCVMCVCVLRVCCVCVCCVCVCVCVFVGITVLKHPIDFVQKLFVLVEVSRCLCPLNGQVSLSHAKIYLAYQITNMEQM